MVYSLQHVGITVKTHCIKGRIEAVLLSEQGNDNLRKECIIKIHVCVMNLKLLLLSHYRINLTTSVPSVRKQMENL
jgi:hypothetical protein